VLAGRVTLPMMPRVVQRVLGVLRRDDASLANIASELEQDPVLSSRVLRLANSSFFTGCRSVASIADAVGTVGYRSLETLVIACGAQAAFAEVPGVNLRQFWMTAAMTGAYGRQMAQRLRVDRETAYSAGLLQGVGHLILCQCHPEVARREFASFRSPWGLALAERELAVFGATHPQVSALWVDRLGMPAAVVEAIAHSLNPPGEDRHTLGSVVQMACSVAGSVAAGDTPSSAAEGIPPGVLSLLHLDAYVASDDFATDYAELTTLPALV
jgi:HD-like signal output (HDOD) protein